MSSPSRRTSPANAADGVSSCMRLRMRRNVDFPQPDGPMRAVTWRASITSETRSRTWWSPNHAETSRASRCGASTAPARIAVGSWVASRSMSCSFVRSGEIRQEVGQLIGDEDADQEDGGGEDDPGLGMSPSPPAETGQSKGTSQNLELEEEEPEAGGVGAQRLLVGRNRVNERAERGQWPARLVSIDPLHAGGSKGRSAGRAQGDPCGPRNRAEHPGASLVHVDDVEGGRAGLSDHRHGRPLVEVGDSAEGTAVRVGPTEDDARTVTAREDRGAQMAGAVSQHRGGGALLDDLANADGGDGKNGNRSPEGKGATVGTHRPEWRRPPGQLGSVPVEQRGLCRPVLERTHHGELGH